MFRSAKCLWPAVLPIGLWLIATGAHAQPVITTQTIDGGGQTSSGGGFEVTGTIGQPDVGELSGAPFAISGGFWTSENPFVPVELLFFNVTGWQSGEEERAEEDPEPVVAGTHPVPGETFSDSDPRRTTNR